MSATKRLLLGESKSAEYQDAETPDRLIAEAAQKRVVHRGPAGEQRNFCLEAEVRIARMNLTGFEPAKPCNTASTAICAR